MNPVGAESEKDDIFMMIRMELPPAQALFDDNLSKLTVVIRHYAQEICTVL